MFKREIYLVFNPRWQTNGQHFFRQIRRMFYNFHADLRNDEISEKQDEGGTGMIPNRNLECLFFNQHF